MNSNYLYPNSPETDDMLSSRFEIITASDIRAEYYSEFSKQELEEIKFENPYKAVARICLYCGCSNVRFWDDYCNCDGNNYDSHHF